MKSWALLEDLALYDNESWNDPRDFAKPVKAISLPQDVLSTSDRHLIEIETQVQRLMEAHLALTQPTQVKKVTTSCEICSGSHDTQYCMEDPKQAFVESASSCTDEAGAFGRHLEERHVIGLISEEESGQDYGPTPTSLKIMFSAARDSVTNSTRRRHNPLRDGVTTFHEGVSSHDPAQDLEYSLSRRRHD
ncbi:hypothetical protein Tco_0405338 [Tanacetum coccineum]|uniref:MAK10-like protein n=1 Tax=Tanacetum coccineum TaxID=301880 RepID=A0ABQ5FMM0_9ASTR